MQMKENSQSCRLRTIRAHEHNTPPSETFPLWRWYGTRVKDSVVVIGWGIVEAPSTINSVKKMLSSRSGHNRRALLIHKM